jgi:hypothetical protein
MSEATVAIHNSQALNLATEKPAREKIRRGLNKTGTAGLPT